MSVQLPTVEGKTESGFFVDEELASVALSLNYEVFLLPQPKFHR
jgi:hypothetical protein